jgi:uncharacterized protein YkwD
MKRLLLLAMLPALSISAATPRVARAQGARSEIAAHQLLHLINLDRRDAGLAPLHLSSLLSMVALSHSEDMDQHGYFAHVSPSGLTPLNRFSDAHIHYQMGGENIGYTEGVPLGQAIPLIEMMMMHSPHHRANLLRPGYHAVGIGVLQDGARVYVTEDFTN